MEGLIAKGNGEIQASAVQKALQFDEFFFRFAAKVSLANAAGGGSRLAMGAATTARQRYSVFVRQEKREPQHSAAGLCADCQFMRLIESDRGSTFYLCERSATDATFAKYPRLPVLQCPGYVPPPAKDDPARD